ncbi:MAG: DNA-processing protein DprA [Planctomycetaceae bacterium]|nr:DNA-processing protein DprA [Planctomycetaceae bacterium]
MSEVAAARIFAPEELIPEITLNMVEGIGSLLTQRLLDHFGDAESVLTASVRDLQAVNGIGAKIAVSISTAKTLHNPETVIKLCQSNGIQIVAKKDVRYPHLLHKIHDPPMFLFIQGELKPCDELAIAIVGTRHMTPYGRRQAERLAIETAHSGFTVISGLAQGIDGTAHHGALTAGGRTVAILGGGLLNIFPKDHVALSRDVAKNGALISEYPPQSVPQKGTFPQRNRIISGMSLGVIIVEAPLKSGALITARTAGEQGREIFAVPGPIDHESSRGCHQLLRDGAVLVESVSDILETLGPLTRPAVHPEKPEPIRHPAELQLNEQESNVLAQISTSPTPIDQVIAGSGLLPHQVLATLGALEMRRLIRRGEANSVARL